MGFLLSIIITWILMGIANTILTQLIIYLDVLLRHFLPAPKLSERHLKHINRRSLPKLILLGPMASALLMWRYMFGDRWLKWLE